MTSPAMNTTQLEALLERVKGWLGLRRSKPEPRLEWRTQCAGHPLSDEPCAAYWHIARSRFGMFEIFEADGNFLLDFPRPMRLPAELFADLRTAKSRALSALKDQS